MGFRSGSYDLPFGRVQVTVNRSAFEWRNRRIVALTPVQEVEIRGLANRYRHAGIGAPLAATTQPIFTETGIQVAPRMKLPMTAVLRLDAPRRQLSTPELRATLDLYNTYDVATTTVAGKPVPLEADQTAVLAYVLASPEIWERELKAFFSGVFSEGAPTQLASIEPYRPGRIPVVFVHGTASSVGRWGDVVNDLMDDPRIRDRYQFWFFTYDTGNPVLYSALLLREALRDAVRKLDPARRDPALSEMVVIGHSQGGLLAKALVVDTEDRVWNAIAYKPIDQVDPTVVGLAQPTNGLHPTEDLSHPFALALTERKAGMARSTLVDGTGLFTREVRRSAMLAHCLHQFFTVVSLVAAERYAVPTGICSTIATAACASARPLALVTQQLTARPWRFSLSTWPA